MEENTLKELAVAFDNASNFSYEFIVGKNGKKSIIISSMDSSEFTHIVGLDHLPQINTMVGNKSILKRALFEQMKRGDFTYHNLTDANIDKLNEPIIKTYNSSTKQPYSIKDRMTSLQNISSILDNAYKGCIYKWDLKQCTVQQKTVKKGICQYPLIMY